MNKFDREQMKRAQNEVILLKNIKKNLPALRKLHKQVCDMWWYEDFIYRFYHGSLKIFERYVQTREIVDALRNLAPEGVELNSLFLEIINEGASGKEFKTEYNQDWTKHTRPMVEAFLHAKFFLEMAIKYGQILKKPEAFMPSGWAALLYLYNLR
ncbi:MAG TPA: hypothetical protein VLX68_01165 [Chitinivibrionales bacterium]|nr:hypothetical protein [Chitinivibrionales bacterium]